MTFSFDHFLYIQTTKRYSDGGVDVADGGYYMVRALFALGSGRILWASDLVHRKRLLSTDFTQSWVTLEPDSCERTCLDLNFLLFSNAPLAQRGDFL